MVMENPFEGKEIWFGVGSQDLYGEEALRQVAIHSAEMVDYLNNTGKIPAKIVLKPTLKSSDGVKEFMVEASANPNVIGVITWCHTFSPAKMWIRGLEVLTKPLLQLATQHHKEIPWETIDMDFMNLTRPPTATVSSVTSSPASASSARLSSATTPIPRSPRSSAPGPAPAPAGMPPTT